MAASGAADGMFRSIYEGCISGCDASIERRPYHKNCGCALHEKEGSRANRQICGHHMTVSYPIRRSWSEGNFAMHLQPSNLQPASRSSSSNLSSLSTSSSVSNLASLSPLSSPAAADGCRSRRLRWTIEEADYDEGFVAQRLNL